MTEGMNRFQLSFAGCVVDIEVKETTFPSRQEMAGAVRRGQVIRAVVKREKDQSQRYPSWQKVNEAQYINLAQVQRFTLFT